RRNDIILCRNVMIYFDEAEQKRLIDKFWNCLNPGGYLFVGHAESLFGLTQKFRMVHENNGTAYQRIEATPCAGRRTIATASCALCFSRAPLNYCNPLTRRAWNSKLDPPTKKCFAAFAELSTR